MFHGTDEEIAARVQGGEAEAFGVLVQRYEAKLTRYGKRFIFDKEDLEDLVQEVFLKAYVNIRSFEAKRKFSPWIYRIAHNEFVNLIRKKNRFQIFSFDADVLFPQPMAKETADGNLNKKELKEMLEKKIGDLKPKYAEPLILYYFEDMSYEEIAEILKIPVSTVGVRLGRGREILRKTIRQHE